MTPIRSEAALVHLSLELGAEETGALERAELDLVSVSKVTRATLAQLDRLRSQIAGGRDPLGEAFARLRSPELRRPNGQTYTPPVIANSMMRWAAANGTPVRVIDPGAGSARFLLAAGRKFPKATLVATDIDPLATLMAKANLAVAGMADRSEVKLLDYRGLELDEAHGSTLFVGNPPYVRHHQITPLWKQWLLETAKRRGVDASALAGLHAYFFLATAEHSQPGDYGVFVTSAEWLDVNYGKLVRQLLLRDLGGVSIHVIEPEAMPFEGAATTAAITAFRIGEKPPSVSLRRVSASRQLGSLTGGRKIQRARLEEATRWSPLTRIQTKIPEGFIELGELCRVHRGTVTGSNRTWVVAGDIELPDSYLTPSVTKARELFAAGVSLEDADALRRVIDLPVDLNEVEDAGDRRLIDEYLREAKRNGAHLGYVAQQRRAWWSVGMRKPAPILATYMARRPPAFVRNSVDARHINIAHGLYPREPMEAVILDRLAECLRTTITLGQGRVYAGGLTKFEPREMERLPVPSPEMMAASE